MKDTKLLALIEASQMADLKATAKRRGVSLAEIVRQALAAYLSVQHRADQRAARGLKTNIAAPEPEVNP